MFAIEEAKLPPPTPATAATRSNVPSETPGSSTIAASVTGTRRRTALKTVQLRPPNFATANVYGSRSTLPTSVGTEVSRNLSAASKPYAGPRKSTSTDQMLQMEKPMCSEAMEKARFRRATRSPVDFQKTGSSGRHSSIHLLERAAAGRSVRVDEIAVVVIGPLR